MYMGVYRFEGEPAALLAAYHRLMGGMPAEKLPLHVCVERPGAIEVYDACPSREVFDAFAASAEFRGAIESAGLPPPQVTRLGETRNVIAGGRCLA
jgi:hypothetical protein